MSKLPVPRASRDDVSNVTNNAANNENGNEPHTSPKAAVFQALSRIPKGKVTTYGDLAEFAGLGKAARFVGTTLKDLPGDSTLPWHRVINSQGKISFPEHHPCFNKQKERLQDEGVNVLSGKVDLKQYRWKP